MMSLQALIVEDDSTLQTIYRFILTRADFEVLFAADGREALLLLETNTPHLIFLDMLLPFIHGTEVLAYIRSQPRLRHSRVIITSSINHYERDMKSEEFLLKPIHAPVVARIAEETRQRATGKA